MSTSGIIYYQTQEYLSAMKKLKETPDLLLSKVFPSIVLKLTKGTPSEKIIGEIRLKLTFHS
jgi:hypothetical protein